MKRLGVVVCVVAMVFSASAARAQECNVERHVPIPNLHHLPYAEARERLIGEGWQPVIINPTQRGEEETTYGNSAVFLGQGFDEVVSCSGTGMAYCLFAFTDVYRNRLEVVTAGEEDAEVGSQAAVVNWRFACDEPPAE